MSLDIDITRRRKRKIKGDRYLCAQYAYHILREDKVGQPMNSKYTVLSKSNHKDGNDNILKQAQFNIAWKRDVEIDGHIHTQW